MTESQKAFEAWAPTANVGRPGSFTWCAAQHGFEAAWTASREAALEEAEKEVQSLDCAHRCGIGSEVVAAIRSLRDADKGK